MRMHAIAVALLLALPAQATDLRPSRNADLATALGLGTDLTRTPPTSDQPYVVRIIEAPAFIGECDGTVASCPDVRLYVTVSSGDLGETPALYTLPASKGWVFVSWDPPATRQGIPMVRFAVRTALPKANIDAHARAAWHATMYRIAVSPNGASYVEAMPGQASRSAH